MFESINYKISYHYSSIHSLTVHLSSNNFTPLLRVDSDPLMKSILRIHFLVFLLGMWRFARTTATILTQIAASHYTHREYSSRRAMPAKIFSLASEVVDR